MALSLLEPDDDLDDEVPVDAPDYAAAVAKGHRQSRGAYGSKTETVKPGALPWWATASRADLNRIAHERATENSRTAVGQKVPGRVNDL